MNDLDRNLAGFRELRLPDAKAEYLRQLQDPTTHDLSFDERLCALFDAEFAARSTRRTKRRIKEAGLRITANKEEFSFVHQRGITRTSFAELCSLSFVWGAHNVVIAGASGVGKTYLAHVLGTEAARANLSVRYHRLSSLMELISTKRIEGSYRSFFNLYSKVDLLIIDDFGLSPISIASSRELLDLIDERIGIHSTIIASQYPIANWHALMEDKTVADAILDRVLSDALRVSLTGDSMRQRRDQNLPVSSEEETTLTKGVHST